MRKWFIFLTAVLLAVGVAFIFTDAAVPASPPIFVAKRAPATTPVPYVPPPAAAVGSPPRRPLELEAAPSDPRLAGSPLAKELNAPSSDAAHDVAALHGLLRQYMRLLGQRPGHPIGNDSDLARVLTGRNPMHLVVLPPTHPSLSPDQRLLDRFGTPYFIHPRGHGSFEIRSAGPDHKLFTTDDAIFNPPPGHTEPLDALPGEDGE